MDKITETPKKANGQISFRAPEYKEKLETIALSKGMTLAEYVKSVLETSLALETPEKPKVRQAKPLVETDEPASDFVVLLKENNEKHDQVIELLEQLVKSARPAEMETNLVYSEEEHSSALAQSLIGLEKELRDNHLMIRLTGSQKKVVSDLLAYRNEKGKIFSGSVEELFFYVLKEAINDSWNSKQPEFEKEFKEAFAEYFAQVKSF